MVRNKRVIFRCFKKLRVKTCTIKRYSAADYGRWNEFIAKAKNATFLFHRDFMEYHADRFQDFSLIVCDGDKWLAVLPAHLENGSVYSHRGLTYGGLVIGNAIKLSKMIVIFRNLLQYLNLENIPQLHLSLIPPIYHHFPSDEIKYVLFLADAVLERRDAMAVIDHTHPVPITKSRKESIRRGAKNGLEIREDNDFKIFWREILIPNLAKKHGAKPVHSIEEIERLQALFPQNIRHFNVYANDRIVAGTTVFESELVAHPQYVSAREDKNMLGSIDYLYWHLISEVFAGKKYFDFGISNEKQGRKLNEGLIFWKETFGARIVAHDFYAVPTANYNLLDNVLI